MATFISDDIQSESGLTATTFQSNTISATTISATTYFGSGSGLTNVPLPPGGVSNSIQYNNSNIISGSTSLLLSGGTLSLTGTSRFNGNFFIDGGISPELRVQWFGNAPILVWTNMPIAPTTWLHSTNGTFTGDATYIVDLTEYSQVRFFFSLQVAGTAASTLSVQYSLNNSTWEVTPLATQTVGNTLGLKDSGWLTIPVAARTFVFIRLIGGGGNNTADPRFSPPTLLFR